MSKAFPKSKRAFLLPCAIGAGFLNGLLGTGGGTILYFCLNHAYESKTKENLAASTVSVMFFCIVSLFFYNGNALLDFGKVAKICIPAALGGLIGAMLLKRLSVNSVKMLFSAVMCLGGILMLIR